MEQSVIKEMPTDELREKILEQKNLLTKMKINNAVSPIENPQKIKVARRSIAQLKTELRKRQLEEQAK